MLAAVFLRPNGEPNSPLDVPYIVYPVLVWIALISGPRRTALAAGIAVAIASLATTRAMGPFDNPYQLQTFLALCVLPVLLLQAVMAEREYAIDKARASDERYRAFVVNSSEAIFRTELAEPMPITLSPDDQVAWVRKHGFVAECNTAFMVALGVKDAQNPIVGTRLGDHPTWSKIYIERIRDAIRNGYQVRNIEHVVHGPYGLDRVLLISMIGIVENGHVLRFWGSGRDVTAMREAEAALAQHDSQLRALATEITLAEERARRKLASELHDGPAQSLVGLSMHLAAIKRGIDDRDQLQRIDECEEVLADATLQTRTLMLELVATGIARERLARSAALAGRARRQAAASHRERGGRRYPEAARGPGHGAAVPDRARAAAERREARAFQARDGALRGEQRHAVAGRHRSGRGLRSARHQSPAHAPGWIRAVQHP